MQRGDPLRLNAPYALIVAFNPTNSLIVAVDAIASQVKQLVIVDNSEKKWSSRIRLRLAQYPNLHVIRLGKNMGLAYALNVGLTYFREKRVRYVVTLDQDSRMPFNGVSRLLKTMIKIQNRCCFGGTGVSCSSRGSKDRDTSVFFCTCIESSARTCQNLNRNYLRQSSFGRSMVGGRWI